jgi:hypothetical protein
MKCRGFSPFDFEHTKNRGKIIPKKTANSVGEHRIGNHNIFLYGLLMFFFLTLVINCILSQLLQKLIALHSILLTSRKKRKILFSECTGLWGTGTLYLCVAKIRQNNVFHSTNCVAHTMALCRWEIIAGRIPGRTAEEVEMFWSKKHQER